ncbi:MAG: bifunctional hydroxymethylpyrimidine kinase/phosphomethylpyrimidine kinase [Candidatus Atribacteria bacterium]|nr:bifunctional hydroxymethylpyrimidine kinase/phosphomethylpyrimidine kinase [Candidatus Atribacteria bacterium]
MLKRVLTIAGSDSGGGAGIQADLKTFCAFGVYGMTAITAVTAQNTQEVISISALKPEMVYNQIKAIAEDIGVDAVKTGMLFNTEIIEIVAEAICKFSLPQLVVDPVMISKSGSYLLEPDAIGIFKKKILPLAQVVTPNLNEAEALSGISVCTPEEMKRSARIIHQMGSKFVLIKGGHLENEEMVDILFDGKEDVIFSVQRQSTKNTHGTGCTYSAALAALLGLGYDVLTAVKIARRYMDTVIQYSLDLGKGCGPINHLAPLFLKCGLTPQEGGWNW